MSGFDYQLPFRPQWEAKREEQRRMVLDLGANCIGMPTAQRRWGAQPKPHLFMDKVQWLCVGQKRPQGIGYSAEHALADWKKFEGVKLLYAGDENLDRALTFHLGSKSASH